MTWIIESFNKLLRPMDLTESLLSSLHNAHPIFFSLLVLLFMMFHPFLFLFTFSHTFFNINEQCVRKCPPSDLTVIDTITLPSAQKPLSHRHETLRFFHRESPKEGAGWSQGRGGWFCMIYVATFRELVMATKRGSRCSSYATSPKTFTNQK